MRATRFVWLRTMSVFVTIYLGGAALSLLMLFDRVGTEADTSHQVVLLLVGTLAIAALAAGALWRERPLPRAATLAAVGGSLVAVLVVHLLLQQYVAAVSPGEPVSVSARRLYDLAPLVAASAPLLVAGLSRGGSRRQLLVVAAAVVAVGWLGAVADFAVHVPPSRLP
jgi:hypothetical protein